MTEPLLIQYRAIAESLLGEIAWQESGKGFCRCPGHDRHTGSTAKRDCSVFVSLERPPSIYCVHTSCGTAVAEKNHALRSQCGKAKWAAELGSELAAGVKPKRRKLTPIERIMLEERRYLERERRKAVAALPTVLKTWRWPSAQILADCPVVLGPAAEHWHLLLSLYRPEDVIWIGGARESGQPQHCWRFRMAAEWLRLSVMPMGPLIAASTFQPGGFRRTKACVARSPFLVVESDTHSRDEIGAIFRFLRDQEKLHLFAVIDTAGRSLHGWFERPANDSMLKRLMVILPALGCDVGPLREPCMSRLPSAWRDGRRQSLIYFHPIGGAR